MTITTESCAGLTSAKLMCISLAEVGCSRAAWWTNRAPAWVGYPLVMFGWWGERMPNNAASTRGNCKSILASVAGVAVPHN